MGRTGVSELHSQLEKTAHDADGLTFDPASVIYPPVAVFPAPIAHNVIPFAGYLIDDGTLETSEERKLRDETRKILAIPELQVAATCVRVPVFTGHSLSIAAQFERPINPEDATALLSCSPGVHLDPVPTPQDATGTDHTLVGRIRSDPTTDNGLLFFLCGDNLRKGAALNAIQIAEILLSQS
jgi:aspartate-semialdehyde dehydrogenase